MYIVKITKHIGTFTIKHTNYFDIASMTRHYYVLYSDNNK